MNYAPELTGIGKYSHEMATWLHKEIHAEICVVCSPPYYPEWKISSGYKNVYQKKIEENITLFRCPIYIPKKITGVTRMLHLASYAISSSIPCIYLAKWKPDLILCVAPNTLGSIIPLLIGKIIRAKTWIHIQDLEIDAAQKLGIIKNKFLIKVLYKIEKAIYNSFEKVTTISEGMKKQLISKGVEQEKVSLMPNWANLKEIYPIEKNHPSIVNYVNQLNLPEGAKIALYSGSISEKQGLDSLILSARHLPPSELVILICGNGPNLEKLKQLAGCNKNIRFIDLVPKNELNLLLNTADVHLLIQKNEIDNQVMPSKLANMIAVGGPILATVNEESNIYQIIESNQLGYTVKPNANKELLEKIVALLKQPQNKIDIQKRCSLYCEQNLQIDKILIKQLKEISEN